MTEIILILLLLFTILTAIFAVFTDNLINSIISLSLFSGALVVVFLLLQAPDVALAEVVIASGITTGFFVITIDKVREN